jgi:hypothetical protein
MACGTYTVAASTLPKMRVSPTRALTLRGRRPGRIRIMNSGGGTLTGNITFGSHVIVSPTTFSLTAGKRATIAVKGRRRGRESVRISSNSSVRPRVNIRVTVR